MRDLREEVKLACQRLNESQEGGLTLSFRGPSEEHLAKAAQPIRWQGGREPAPYADSLRLRAVARVDFFAAGAEGFFSLEVSIGMAERSGADFFAITAGVMR